MLFVLFFVVVVFFTPFRLSTLGLSSGVFSCGISDRGEVSSKREMKFLLLINLVLLSRLEVLQNTPIASLQKGKTPKRVPWI